MLGLYWRQVRTTPRILYMSFIHLKMYIQYSASLTTSWIMKSMAEIGQDPLVAGEDPVPFDRIRIVSCPSSHVCCVALIRAVHPSFRVIDHKQENEING